MQIIPDPSSCEPGQLKNIIDEAMVREENWGESLELFYAQLSKAQNLVNVVNQLSEAKGKNALAYIYSRAMLLGNEIFRLVSGGYPDGAMARSRCLHELVLCGFFISEMSAKKCDPLIGTKYIDHEWIRRHALLNAQQSNFKRIMKSPEYSEELQMSHKATQEDLKAVNEKIEELKKIYGTNFAKSEYGWAYTAVEQHNKIIGKPIGKCSPLRTACCEKICCENPCCKRLRVNLSNLKEAVGNEDLESVFQLGNQATHAGALPALPLLSHSLMHHVLSNDSVQTGLYVPIWAASYGLERILYLTHVNLKDHRIETVWHEHCDYYKKILIVTEIAERKAMSTFKERIESQQTEGRIIKNA